jgi:hypothetical protein
MGINGTVEAPGGFNPKERAPENYRIFDEL